MRQRPGDRPSVVRWARALLAGGALVALPAAALGAPDRSVGAEATPAPPALPSSQPAAVPTDALVFVTGDAATGSTLWATRRDAAPRRVWSSPPGTVLQDLERVDGRTLAATVEGEASSQVVAIDVPSGTSRDLAQVPTGVVSLVAAPSADRLAVSGRDGEVALVDVASGATETLALAEADAAVTPSFACDGVGPALARVDGWSEQGLLVSRTSAGCESAFVEVLLVRSSEQWRRLHRGHDVADPAVARDGTRFSYVTQAGTVVVPLQDTGDTLPTPGEPSAPFDGAASDLSGQGRAVGLVADAPDDWRSFDLVTADADGGDARRSRSTGSLSVRAPEWDADGQRIGFLAVSEQGTSLWVTDDVEATPRRVDDGVGADVLDFEFLQ